MDGWTIFLFSAQIWGRFGADRTGLTRALPLNICCIPEGWAGFCFSTPNVSGRLTSFPGGGRTKSLRRPPRFPRRVFRAMPMRFSVAHIMLCTGTMQSTPIRFNEFTSIHEEMHIISPNKFCQISTETSKKVYQKLHNHIFHKYSKIHQVII